MHVALQDRFDALPGAGPHQVGTWDGVEEDEGKSEICYTYPFSHAWGGKYAKYAISKVLFSGQGEMVAKMFNKNLEDVRVLVPEFC